MLKELVRERLFAAADEIYVLFERTIASYEEQLCRAKEENERQRQQLEAVSKTQMLLRVEEVQLLIGQQQPLPPEPYGEISSSDQAHPLHLKEEEEEADISKSPPTVISMKSEDDEGKPSESTRLHRRSPRDDYCGGALIKKLLAPLSDNNAEILPDSKTNCEGYGNHLKRSEEKTPSGKKNMLQMRKRFSCTFCAKSFAKNQHMTRHMRTHTGEKPFRCSVCGKTFARKEHVDSHMTTHTGEKPFVCSLCGRRFSHKSYLRTHMRTHTGEKPFSCSVCGECYSHRSSLNAHMRGHNTERIMCGEFQPVYAVLSIKYSLKMLKDLVRQRLMTAADEIFELFQTAIASYEEQLCRAREETAQHRRQLEAVCRTQIVISIEDLQRLITPQEEVPTQLQEEPQPKNVEKEEDEANVAVLPISDISVEESKKTPPQPSQLPFDGMSGHQSGEQPTDTPLAAPPQSDHTEDRLRSDTDCEGDSEQPECSKKKMSLVKKSSFKTRSVKTRSVEKSSVEKSPVTKNPVTKNPVTKSPVTKSPVTKSPVTKSPVTKNPVTKNPAKKSKVKNSPGKKMTPKCKKHRKRKEIFKCSICDKRFTQKGHRTRHMKTHTGEKPFSCSVCGKTFGRKENLDFHMRTHTGEKPFGCSVCGTHFSRKEGMEVHMRRHTGEKPYRCSICGKTFSVSSSMATHMRIHTGEKPFHCLECGESYTHRNSLTLHMRIHK
ncbi:zinc finger protein 37-like [Syngnathoides biaculeatus]|uniref:zinc finger protein 37-like n=1 Tax=Syngnathoides biaculeatus TaxID=300417 RepID=UPI002ADE405D|nr:zinc finger protein 37-like [Syngnathoides biaculeatus]